MHRAKILALSIPAIAALLIPVSQGSPATTGRTVPVSIYVQPIPHSPRHHPMGHPPSSYVVQRGDTLSSIAFRQYGHAELWPDLWWINRKNVHNPLLLLVGQRLKLSAWHPNRAWLMRAARNAIPVVHKATMPASQAPVSSAAVTFTGGSGFQACVIARESGGNPAAVNPISGAGGLYQFLPSTWAALGHSGLPQNASVAEQNQAFAQEVAHSGTTAWSPYDGC